MSIQRGFVRSIEARNDGWIEVVLVAPHANDATRTMFLQNLDGDLTVVHRRLAKLALLRDALAQTLPVEVEVKRTDNQGDLIEDVRILRTRSITGRKGDWWMKVHVIGLTDTPHDSIEQITIKYTTAPDQQPEGDISENGSFMPEAKQASVHQDSVLLPRLMAALREGLQVKLGLLEGEIHAVEMISPLGSAAKPIWITFGGKTLCEDPTDTCVNEVTTKPPSQAMLDGVPRAVSWKGQAYFNKGIWRLAIYSSDSVELKVDDKTPCAEVIEAESHSGVTHDAAPSMMRNERGYVSGTTNMGDRTRSRVMAHCYLDGLHDVEVIVRGKTCGSPFKAMIYRIR